jgi:HlyD family secretion protein
MAVTTIAGIAAVMPFFAVLGDPGLIERNAALHWLQVRFEISGHPQFTLLLGCGFIVLLLVSSVVNLAGSVAMSRFAWRVGDRLRVRLFTQYLGRDYRSMRASPARCSPAACCTSRIESSGCCRAVSYS